MARRLLTLVSSSTLQRVLRPPVMIRMSTSFTDSPAWIEKTKMRFALLNVDKNGIYDSQDLAIIAKNLAAYRNQGSDEEKRYFKMLQPLGLVDEKGVTEEEFIEQSKILVSQPDAKERVKVLVDIIFKLMDADEDGIISYEEFLQLHKAFNIKQEMIDMLFNAADTNGDGVIDYEETYESFIKFYFSAE